MLWMYAKHDIFLAGMNIEFLIYVDDLKSLTFMIFRKSKFYVYNATGIGWDQCRVKYLDSDNILTHLNQPQHILDDPKT